MNRFILWLSHWLDIVDSLVKIVSFSYLDSYLGVRLRIWMYLNRVDTIPVIRYNEHSSNDDYSVRTKHGAN